MGLVLTDAGAEKMLTAYFGGGTLTLKLFTNNHTPADTDSASDYTEATGGGYAATSLVTGDLTVSIVGGIAQAAYPAQEFDFTGALTSNLDVYGYYVVDGAGELIYAEQAGALYTPTTDGSYTVTPVFQLSKGTPT